MNTKKLFYKKTSFFGLFSGLLISSLMVISVFMLWQRAWKGTDSIVHKDVSRLQNIFNQIQKDCYIISFAHAYNYIDFLNVISFAGSQVGPMNLAFAKNWRGSYLKTNPTIQDKLYAILKNKQGWFIVPGNGVKLSNGKVIGKDIVLGYETDMRALMHNRESLLSEFGSLAAQIQVGSRSLAHMMQDAELFYVQD